MGICRYLHNERNNCGVCGNVCPGTPATQGCLNGVCTCNTGLTKCGTQCLNLQFDRNNCGACGTVCASNLVCNMGACVPP